jgi:hypothetical protein
MENLYRIEELFTTGWDLLNPKLVKLTKDECKKQLEILMNEGHSPERLRAVLDNQT